MTEKARGRIHLNVPYVTTFIMDYVFLASMLALNYWLAAGEKLNFWTAGGTVLMSNIIDVSREQFYWYLFRDHESFSKCKADFKWSDMPHYWFDALNTLTTIFMQVGVMTYLGFTHFDGIHDSADFWHTCWECSRDFWIIKIITDNTSFRFVHPWMHKQENYWIHKHHHMSKNASTHFTSWLFSPVDLFFEFGIGFILGLLVKQVVFGDASVHILTVALVGRTDSSLHSQNPYTQAIGNPFLDYMFKMNIAHNLHHSYQVDPKYMVLIPTHHLNAKQRALDIDLYNKIMDTKVDFRFLIS